MDARQNGLYNLPLAQELLPEREATPDEAFELGKVAGYDQAMREAYEWIAEGVKHFEDKAHGEVGRWWLNQISRVFGGPIRGNVPPGDET